VGARDVSRRFALVDRDGTINVERNHLSDPDELELIPGSAPALRRLRDLGLGVVVLTNQAQVGRGLLAPDRLDAIHERLERMLASEGVEVEAIVHCPHRPEDGCRCRKPAPGMALDAAARFGFDPARAFVVGDHAADVGLGRAIGATTFLVLTGHGPEEAPAVASQADHVVADLVAAVDIIAGLVGEDDRGS
jgi:D-glycero-D-manno-heptose 1,7-bisphosphate phosphatase